MDTKRVVITGMGLLTPVGNTVEEFWNNISKGNIGIAPITRFSTDDMKAKVAAEVKDFDCEQYFPKKDSKRNDLFSQYAMAAAVSAVSDAGFGETDLEDNVRVGVLVGSGIGGLKTMEDQVTRLNEKGPNRVAPLFIPMTIGNMAAGNIALKLGITGTCAAVVTACASSAHCIGEAFRNIKHGYSDVILAGGSEASITRIGMAGFTSLTALSESNDPKRASIPFDKDRNGFVMGEGASVLVIEELSHALARNAKIYAEVVGYGSTCDAHHMTSPDPEGKGASNAMIMAMNEAGITPVDVSYVNAHGTGTPSNDLPETIAIKKALGEHAYKVPVTSSKSMTGHMLGAAGSVEASVCALVLVNNFAPPTMGLETPEEGCDLNYLPGKGEKREMQYALSNSFGFGGHNAVLCLKKY